MAFLKEKKRMLLGIAAAAAFLAASVFLIYELWLYAQPKFRDVTIELGTDAVSIEQFYTEYTNPKRVRFVSDPSVVDLNRVGEYELTLQQGWPETVTLSVVDTTAPQVSFVDRRVEASGYVPRADDFIEQIRDFSATHVEFEQIPAVGDDYGDVPVTLLVTDEWGNQTRGTCVLETQWILPDVTLEYGQKLTKEDVLLNISRDESLVEQAAIDAINESDVGEYTITSATDAKTLTCQVHVQDTTPPELKLKEVRTYIGNIKNPRDFVESVADASGDVELRLATEVDFTKAGTYTVTVEAEDIHGNISKGETTLVVTRDMAPPAIGGLRDMTVQKNSKPDYLSGVTAWDDRDGFVDVSYDASMVNTAESGTYYVTYTAMDSSRNVTTRRRKVVVARDPADTAKMVQEIASKLDNDPEHLRDYVRSHIGYNHDWGSGDPVWYGFTMRVGNCYVHAMCLKALFDIKGIQSQLIWVTNKTHYWLQVNINGQWKHIDPTPSTLHGRYSLMNDEQRASTLSGRDWDRSAWPECK